MRFRTLAAALTVLAAPFAWQAVAGRQGANVSLVIANGIVITVDGNVVRLRPEELADYVRRERVDLVGIGGMTRTIHRSYAVADSLRAQESQKLLNYGFQFYDALIAAAALEAECTTLYSEDFQDGQLIEGRLTVRNPFR